MACIGFFENKYLTKIIRPEVKLFDIWLYVKDKLTKIFIMAAFPL